METQGQSKQEEQPGDYEDVQSSITLSPGDQLLHQSKFITGAFPSAQSSAQAEAGAGQSPAPAQPSSVCTGCTRPKIQANPKLSLCDMEEILPLMTTSTQQPVTCPRRGCSFASRRE